jgi:hypothetical protein
VGCGWVLSGCSPDSTAPALFAAPLIAYKSRLALRLMT